MAPSFDEEGKTRYREFLRGQYQGDITELNRSYGTKAVDFSELVPEEYWYGVRYAQEELFTEDDVNGRTTKFRIWRDNARWKMQELTAYFKEMKGRLKEKHDNLFLCPDLTQWGYFLNIYGRMQQDLDNAFSDLWDTAVRGMDVYALAEHVDSCHFITVPVTPDGLPDAYVVSCQHSMMRVMNEGKPMVGGIYWGRYIYDDIYAFLTPAEMIATMAAAGIDGYTCYGMNGLDDGGVLNRMDTDFLDSLKRGNDWLAQILARRAGTKKKEIALLFPSEMAHLEPFEVGNNKIRRLDLLGWYHLCCDLGYQVDVISMHEIERGALDAYRILIVPTNDCYDSAGHEQAEAAVKAWVKAGGVLLHGPLDALAESCFGISGIPCEKLPYRYGKVIIPQGERFCRYEGGEEIAPYVDNGGSCVVSYGTVYAFGVQIGAAYAAKNIPHVPYAQGNKEMYPFIQSKTTLVKDVLYQHLTPESRVRERGIETGIFENGMVIVNHRSTPYTLPQRYAREWYQYEPARTPEGTGILMGHSAVWVEWQEMGNE